MALDQVSEKELDNLSQGEKNDNHTQEETEMSFLDHLEVLRWHLIRSIVAIGVFTIVAFANSKIIFGTIILGPSKADFWTYRQLCYIAEWMGSKSLCIGQNITLINIHLGGQFFMHITSSVVIGLVCAFPYFFWEMWRFIKPGLYKKERKAAQGATFFVSLLFLTGVLFGYYIVAPLSINFLVNYDLGVANQITLTNFVSTLTALVLACGLLFQLPLVAFFLAQIGILTPEMMRKYRRHAIVVILIVAGVITPPDVMSQILVAVPLTILYEMSITIVKRVVARQEAEAAAA
ncbi:MAG: twin-arginine translocase subunit TatC [Microscillaceae bacterium]|nr:twin-arginine translocase subunit TatC [Microscillaceae bacterium]